MNLYKIVILLFLPFSFLIIGCATETSRSLPIKKLTNYNQYSGIKYSTSIGKFDNRSSYMNGLFSDGIDRLGNQSKIILSTVLQETGRFNLLDRMNMNELKNEANIQNQTQQLKGANYVITGAVTEFGRKEIGDRQLFGILGRGKSQIAYAKVSLNIIDVYTSEVVFSAQGAGEYKLSNREVIVRP